MSSSRRSSSRFVRHWLAPLALVVSAAAIAGIRVAVQTWGGVAPGRPPSADQRASDGTSTFTGAGVDYLSATGLVIVRVGDGALPARDLGLADDGDRTIDPEIPVQVRVLGPDGAFVLELADAVHLTTSEGRITEVEVGLWGAPSFREMIALLQSRAENVGWTDDDLAALQDDLTEAQRIRDGEVYSAELPGRSAIGATVSARVTVDLAAASTTLTFLVRP